MVIKQNNVSRIHRQGHGHKSENGNNHTEDALLGGHLGTEVVEKIGHSAHHGAHDAGHAVVHAKAEGTSMAAETTTDLAQVSQSGHAKLASEVAKHGTKAAHHLSAGLTTALATSAAASGGLGAVMLYKGGKELAHGVKEKDGEKIAEGVGGLAVGSRSVAAATVMTSMVASSSALTQVASFASKTLTPLGLVHGAVDVGLGVKDLVEGETTAGLLKMGFGTSVIAGAAVGGIPLTLVAIGFLGAKVGHAVIKNKRQQKNAHEAETQQNLPEDTQP